MLIQDYDALTDRSVTHGALQMLLVVTLLALFIGVAAALVFSTGGAVEFDVLPGLV